MMKTSSKSLFLAACLATSLAGLACDTTYDFDPIEVGESEKDREPRAWSNAQFIRSIYADVLGRTPEVYVFSVRSQGEEVFRFPIDEQDFLVGVLDGVGDPAPLRALITAGLVNSLEADIPAKTDVADPAEYIASQFRRLLGRNPSVYELRAFVAAWNSDPAVGPRTVIRALIGSRRYQSY